MVDVAGVKKYQEVPGPVKIGGEEAEMSVYRSPLVGLQRGGHFCISYLQLSTIVTVRMLHSHRTITKVGLVETVLSFCMSESLVSRYRAPVWHRSINQFLPAKMLEVAANFGDHHSHSP